MRQDLRIWHIFGEKAPLRSENERSGSLSFGFTIIELLIATLIFSMVLLLITYGVIRFNQAYYGGLVQSNTQNVARTIMDNISQAIQFNGNTISPGISGIGGWQGLCVGNEQYQYLIGKQLKTSGTLGSNQANKVLLLNTNVPNCSGQTPGTSLNSDESIGEHMRLANLTVSQVGSTNLYTIDVRVVYGDDDLLCSPGHVVNSCNTATTMPLAADFQQPDLQCKSLTGSQFCAVSELNTTVEKRVN